MYLGMLSVSPFIQAKGIGRQLMNTAEDYAKNHNCSSIFMKVISIRHELIAWYERKGYKTTGETEPFPADNRFGIPVKPLEFVIMEKKL
jgi:ribosomal protein S18 acetylase RimI-like enzyme